MKYLIIFLLLPFLAFRPIAKTASSVGRGLSTLPKTPEFARGQQLKTAKNKYAVVVGISNYQAAGILDIRDARRDAETFAAWLYSESGGNLPQENVVLLTDAQATLSRVGNAINEMSVASGSSDGLILYFAGYGAEQQQVEDQPEFFYFFDTPPDEIRAGSYPMLLHFANLVKKKKNPYLLVTNLYHRKTSAESSPIDFVKNRTNAKSNFKHQIVVHQLDTAIGAAASEINAIRLDMNHHLMDALLGLADLDRNLEVTYRELQTYFTQFKVPKETAYGSLFVAASNGKAALSHVDVELMKATKNNTGLALPSILKAERTQKELQIMANLDPKVQDLYQNFLIALKLGHLLPPDEPDAANLLDSMQGFPGLDPLYSDFRRKLIAALQDETQQAINAYLNADARELLRRQKFKGSYLKYPLYLEKSIELMGKQNFMYKILQAKMYYFLGLNKHFEAIEKKDNNLFSEALALQFKGLEFEPEAAFILNEIGNLYYNKEDNVLSKKYFLQAISFTPTWSIPYANLCNVYSNEPPWAIKYGKKAVELNPENATAWNNLGTAYMSAKDLEQAEFSLARALKLQPKFPDALYNFACIRSLQNDIENAGKLLESALYNGFDDVKHMAADPDLTNLRSAPIYTQLLKKYYLTEQK